MANETEEHKALKKCIADLLGGKTETWVNGRVDVKAPRICAEIERSGREDRMKRAIEKMSRGPCGGGILVVPPAKVEMAQKMAAGKNIEVFSIDKVRRICKRGKKPGYR